VSDESACCVECVHYSERRQLWSFDSVAAVHSSLHWLGVDAADMLLAASCLAAYNRHLFTINCRHDVWCMCPRISFFLNRGL